MVDGTAPTRRRRAHPAGDGQPARPGRRRDRHRQDQDAAADGRAALRRRRAGVRSPTSRATCPGWPQPGEAERPGRRTRATEVGQALEPAGVPGRVPRARRHGARASPLRATMTSFGPTLLAEGARPQRGAGVLARPGLPLRRQGRAAAARPQGPARGRPVPHSATRARPSSRSSAGCRKATAGVILRELIAFEDQGADDVLRRARVRHRRPAAHRRRTAAASCRCSSCRSVQDRPRAVLDVPDVAARRPVRGAARGRRPRQAEAGLLLRRGAPALRRRVARRSSRRSRRPCG